MRWFGHAPAAIQDRSVDRFFNNKYRQLLDMDRDFQPALNTRENEKEYAIELAMPGLNKKDVDVFVHDGVLTVMCDVHQEDERDNDDYVRREFSYTSMQRTFALPKDVNEEQITADYDRGILHIRLPREKQNDPASAVSRIEIR